MNKRTARSEFQQHRESIRQGVHQQRAVDFFNVLTGPLLLELTEAHLPAHRERHYPPTVTLSMFIKQVLEADGSCQRAVNGWASQCAAEGLSPHSVRTGAYCRARQRLPAAMVMALTRETGKLLCTQADSGWRWRGRTVKLVDGHRYINAGHDGQQPSAVSPAEQPGTGGWFSAVPFGRCDLFVDWRSG